jgi:hypothetical protein
VPEPDSLRMLESLLMNSGVAAALAFAAWSAWQCVPRDSRTAAPGESTWTAVAVLILVVVFATVGTGAVRAF